MAGFNLARLAKVPLEGAEVDNVRKKLMRSPPMAEGAGNGFIVFSNGSNLFSDF